MTSFCIQEEGGDQKCRKIGARTLWMVPKDTQTGAVWKSASLGLMFLSTMRNETAVHSFQDTEVYNSRRRRNISFIIWAIPLSFYPFRSYAGSIEEHSLLLTGDASPPSWFLIGSLGRLYLFHAVLRFAIFLYVWYKVLLSGPLLNLIGANASTSKIILYSPE